MKKISEEEFNQYLGKRLMEIRKINKMSISELGARIGVSYQQIRKYENGTNKMSPKRLLMCSETFEVGVDYFYGTDDDATKYGYSKAVLLVAEEVSNLPTMSLRTSVFQMAKAINNYAETDSGYDDKDRMTA